jgi:putative transposase
VSTAGTIHVDKVFYKVDVDHAFQQVLLISDRNQAGHKILITNLEGEILAEHTRPTPGIHHVGNGRRPGTRPSNPGLSPKS